jgi:hypothetical protein
MDKVKNEQGYALVTVLLVVTVFMVVFLSFMGLAFSSAKQNEVVDQKSQSVAAAEMGIAYYQVEIQRMFESKQAVVNKHVIDLMKLPTSSTTNFKREATTKMASELQSMILVGSRPAPIPIEGHSNAAFSIENFTAIPDPIVTSNKIIISFDIIGNEEGKLTRLKAKMTIDLDTITNQAAGTTNGYILPSNTKIPIPKVPECKTLSCNPVYIKGNSNFPSGNNQLKNGHTIYTTGTITLNGNGNENGKSGLRIHAEDGIYIGKNMNNTANAVIETNGEAKFMQNLKLYSKSELFAQKLYVNHNLELFDSKVYIGADGATILGPQLKIDSLSKMCVLGNLNATLSGIATNNLIVHGLVNGQENSSYREKDLNLFKAKCGTQVLSEFAIKWDNSTETVINNVDY